MFLLGRSSPKWQRSLLSRILSFAKVPNKRLHDVISCASRTGFNDPLNLSALKVEVCFLELLLGTEPAKPLCPNFYLNTRTKEGEN